MVYIANDAVPGCLISCNTSSVNARPLLDLFLKTAFDLGFNAWMSRVPADSNIVDDPSRGECSLLESFGCTKTVVDVDSVWNDVLVFFKRGVQRPAEQSPPS